MERRLDSSNWHAAIIVLSLDFNRSVYDKLGIGITCEETLRGLARDAVLGRLPEDSLDTKLLLGEVGVSNEEGERFLGAVSRALGSSDRDRLKYWAHYIACMERYNPWTLYFWLLSGWGNAFRRTGKDCIGFTEPLTIEKRYSFETATDDVKQILERERQKPLTEWDASRLVEFGEISPGSDYFPFVDKIELVVAMERFQRFWKGLLHVIGPADVEALSRAARTQAEKKHNVFCSPEQLPLP